MESVITTKDLKKSFNSNEVLKGINLNVKKSEIFALLGNNGAGKTTIINILSTLLHADSGIAEICGYDVTKNPEAVREKISLTGQFAAVDDILTGRENIKIIARLRCIEHPDNITNDLLERFGLKEAADRRADTYSGGMKRKLDIAMSLVGHPQVIFLDEPTTGLDPKARLEVWNMVKDLADSGTTIFLTTQYLEEAEHLADRIGILNDGTIISIGTLDELRKLIPPVKVEYIEKRPSLEEIFLSITRNKENNNENHM